MLNVGWLNTQTIAYLSSLGYKFYIKNDCSFSFYDFNLADQLSNVDLICQAGMLSAVFFGWFPTNICMARVWSHLNTLNAQWAKVERSGLLERSAIENAKGWSVFQIACHCFLTVGYGSMSFLLMLHISIPWHIGLVVLIFVLTIFHSPSGFLVQLITSQYMHLAIKGLQSWQKRLDCILKKQDKREAKASAVFDLLEAISYFDDHFGPLLLCEMAICFIGQIFTYFFLFFCYTLINQFSLSKLYFYISSLLLQLIFLLRANNLSSLGSRLCLEMKKAKRSLQRFRRTRYTYEDEGMKYELDSLEDQLSNETPLKPCDVYVLNRETMNAGLGLLLTYTIVLIQFRIADSKETSIDP